MIRLNEEEDHEGTKQHLYTELLINEACFEESK